tara:strand:- start:229 stop:462 length:234 start_codon:yes stop_codon:yes gene_type:complete
MAILVAICFGLMGLGCAFALICVIVYGIEAIRDSCDIMELFVSLAFTFFGTGLLLLVTMVFFGLFCVFAFGDGLPST